MSETHSIAFLGFGRFGQAFAERLLETGATVRVWEPKRPVPAELAATSLEALLAPPGFVILAVPVASTATVLAEILPHLTPDHLVLDVGSVKSGPVSVMERTLGDRIPWLGTHPLFGPNSLALGEPLGAILCPNPAHPSALAKGRGLFESIGCEIIEQHPETHDAQMAESHALTYFVAKGLIDAEVNLDPPFAPPSVKAVARTVETVREDAAHLFASLHRENPYAAEARRKLLEAMTATDAALRSPAPVDEQAHAEAGPLHVDDLDQKSAQLRAARDIIDELDQSLVELLARRAAVSERAAHAKADIGHGVRDPAREAALLATRCAMAEALGLDGQAVGEIFAAVLSFSRGHQVTHGKSQG